MRIEEDRYGDVVLLRVAGGINQDEALKLQEKLLGLLAGREPRLGGVVIDLSDVPYVSSAGLRALMIGAKEGGKNMCKLVLARLQPCVGEVFQISRFDRIIPTFDDVADALASISGEAAAIYKAR